MLATFGFDYTIDIFIPTWNLYPVIVIITCAFKIRSKMY